MRPVCSDDINVTLANLNYFKHCLLTATDPQALIHQRQLTWLKLRPLALAKGAAPDRYLRVAKQRERTGVGACLGTYEIMDTLGPLAPFDTPILRAALRAKSALALIL